MFYKCDTCGCYEHTALGFYWSRNHIAWPEPYRGKQLCSEHGPPQDIYHNPTKWGRWHGQFPQRSARGMKIDQHGYLWTAEQIAQGEVPPSSTIIGEVP